MKNFKNTNLLIILFVTILSTTSCTMYGQPNNVNPTNANDYANISALMSDCHYVKFSYAPTGTACFRDQNGDGLADLKAGYGYKYGPTMQDYWFAKDNSIARGTPCDRNGNSLTLNGVEQSIPIAAGTFYGVQAFSNAYPHIYEFSVTSTWYMNNVDFGTGSYIRSSNSGTNLKLVINP